MFKGIEFDQVSHKKAGIDQEKTIGGKPVKYGFNKFAFTHQRFPEKQRTE